MNEDVPNEVAPLGLWTLRDQHRQLVGLLVADEEDPGLQMTAILPTRDGAGLSELKELAAGIVKDREVPDLPHVRELRKYGRPDSTTPTPAQFYSWLVSGPDERADAAEPREPYCLFRLSRLARQHIAQEDGEYLDTGDRLVVGIESEDGVTRTVKLAFEPYNLSLVCSFQL